MNIPSVVLGQRIALGITESSNAQTDLENYISVLEEGDPHLSTLQKLVFLCIENPAIDVLSPLSPDSLYLMSPSPFTSSGPVPTLHRDMWEKNRNFDKLFNAVGSYMVSTKVCTFLFVYIVAPQSSDRMRYR